MLIRSSRTSSSTSPCRRRTSHVTLAALERGCHVLGEKPMADTMENARRMVEAARKAGKHLRRHPEPPLRAADTRVPRLARLGASRQAHHAQLPTSTSARTSAGSATR